MIRLFLDANILFSAAWREKNGLLQLWNLPQIRLVTSEYALLEAQRNIARKLPAARERLSRLTENMEIIAATCSLDDHYGLPEKDRPILEAAIASRCTVLITGDITDFGHLIGKKILGVKVMTVSMFLTQ